MEKYLKEIDNVIENGRFKDNWESLGQYTVPSWYKDLKFGIFIHWGVYSVPAFSSEWYPRGMYIKGTCEYEHHIKTYGEHKNFGYKDFIPMFKAEKFNPTEWAELFENAGAQYVIPVGEHHDGFQMYDSDISIWNAKNMGPGRNVLGELYDAFDKKGLVKGVSSHRVEHWFFLGHGKEFDSDIKEPLQRGDLYWPSMPEADHHDLFSTPVPTEEFLNDWLVRCCEIVDKYQPSIIYFDWWIQHSALKPYLKKFAAYYYNRATEWGKEVVINYKHDAFQFGTAVVDIERGQLAEAKPYVWQTDTAVAKNSWCYTKNNSYKTSSQIIQDLVDIVSKNGRLLLNIGPKADGTIPEEDKNILLEIGDWLKINGEAIYSSKSWRIPGEGPTKVTEGQFSDNEAKNYTKEDIRFTVKGECIYAICLNMKGSSDVCIKSLNISDCSVKPNFSGIIKDVKVLGHDKCQWTRDTEGLHITTDFIDTDKPVVFKIIIE
ncbi:MAG: alpha-L-fucosidase [Clostridia bacterium]